VWVVLKQENFKYFKLFFVREWVLLYKKKFTFTGFAPPGEIFEPNGTIQVYFSSNYIISPLSHVGCEGLIPLTSNAQKVQFFTAQTKTN
jgi:hypothetical protein